MRCLGRICTISRAARPGVKAAWNGLTVGGGFVYDGAGTLPLDRRPGHVGIDSVISEFNLGATYDLGRFSFGASWAHDYRKALPSNRYRGGRACLSRRARVHGRRGPGALRHTPWHGRG